MYQLVEHPAAPFTTLAGSTKGPCVNVGVAMVQGAPTYVGEQELRSMLKAFGWPAPEAHARIAEQLDAAVARNIDLESELIRAREQIAALELIVTVRQPEPVEA